VPIERGAHILPQLRAEHSFDYDRAVRGLQLAAWGMFKKVVIADRLAVVVNTVYSAPDGRSPAQLTVATVFFAFQIYCDFSGYSDIALGSAEVLGVRLVQNFKRPYLAASIAEFWKRWHISLSSWFRDYVYIPLGGSRAGGWAHTRNVLATFLLSGFWHGASWNYILWGGYHGLLLAVTRPFDALERERRGWGRLITAAQIAVMFVLTNIGWLLFRETSLPYLVKWLTLSPWASSALERDAALYLFLVTAIYSVPLWLHSAYVAWAPAVHERLTRWGNAGVWAWSGAQALVTTAMGLVILLLRSRTSLDFIYFQF